MIQISKYTALVAVITLLTLVPLWGQTPPEDFHKAQSERNAAMRSGNAKVYASYTTDNFTVVMPDGSIQSKADRMAVMTKTPHREVLGPVRDETFIISENTIVVNWISAIQGKDARFTEVWVKRSGIWKVVAAHVSMIQMSK